MYNRCTLVEFRGVWVSSVYNIDWPKTLNDPEAQKQEFIEILDRKQVKMRVWERGTGETLACGTGACAVAVSTVLNGYTENEVTVKLLGGNLKILWNKENNHIYMTGPARTVFEGEI